MEDLLNNKDSSIIEIIKKFNIFFGPGKFEIVDYWDADLCAIGLRLNRKVVYINSFAYVRENEVKYDYDFEVMDKKNNEKMDVIKSVRGASGQTLIEDVKDFFEMTPRSP
jgi:hypothetical protein